MADRAPERPETDRELLLLTVQELGHVKAHLAELTEKVGIQNGRLAVLEKAQGENIPERLTALEHWRIGVVLAFGFIGATWPLLIFEVRQKLFEFWGFGG
jgi:hypothetical protein